MKCDVCGYESLVKDVSFSFFDENDKEVFSTEPQPYYDMDMCSINGKNVCKKCMDIRELINSFWAIRN
jgi:hypothetical protein